MLELEAHGIYCFNTFNVEFGRLLNRQLVDLVEESDVPGPQQEYDRAFPKSVEIWLPDRLKPAVQGHYRDVPMFEEPDDTKNKKSGKLRGTDFYVPIQRLVS